MLGITAYWAIFTLEVGICPKQTPSPPMVFQNKSDNTLLTCESDWTKI